MELQAMHVTMVKKRLASGEPCRKCLEAEQILRARGAWDQIDQVVWAVENEPESEGMQLARHYGIEAAPFFLVDEGNGAKVAYGSVLKLLRERLESQPARPLASVDPADIDGIALRARAAPTARDRALDAGALRPRLRARVQRRRRRRADRHGRQERLSVLGVLPRHRPPARRDVSLHRARAHALRRRDRAGLPRRAQLQPFVRKKGLFSFYEDGHQECCGVRKVEPLRRTLRGYRAWMTGQRRDQSPTRTHVPVAQADTELPGPRRARCSRSIRSPAGARRKPGPTCASTTSRSTSCTSAASCRSAASPARARLIPASTSAKAAGGGKTPRRRSAACTACPPPKV